MSNRNATATWSGFSHQGHIGLLVALRKIVELDGGDYDKYFLEYEMKEDASIYEIDVNGNRNYLSVHQVKAYYSKGHILSTYKDVLKGTEIIEKDINGVNIKTGKYRSGDWCDKDNFLHTVMKITDWTDKNIKKIGNKNGVKRYEYIPDKFYCDTTEISGLIINELFKITGVIEKCQRIFNSLLFLLDEKIRFEHKTKPSKDAYEICFSFKELMENINSDVLFDNENIFNSRECFYNEFSHKIKNYKGDLKQDHYDYISLEVMKKIYELENDEFLNFSKLLNMGKPEADLNKPHYNFNSDGLKQVFFKLLIEVDNTVPVYDKILNVVQYDKKDIDNKYILTSIMDDIEDQSDVVMNIFENMNLNNILWENQTIINKNIEGDFYNLNPKFTESRHKENSFMYFSNNRLINVENGKKELSDE